MNLIGILGDLSIGLSNALFQVFSYFENIVNHYFPINIGNRLRCFHCQKKLLALNFHQFFDLSKFFYIGDGSSQPALDFVSIVSAFVRFLWGEKKESDPSFTFWQWTNRDRKSVVKGK